MFGGSLCCSVELTLCKTIFYLIQFYVYDPTLYLKLQQTFENLFHWEINQIPIHINCMVENYESKENWNDICMTSNTSKWIYLNHLTYARMQDDTHKMQHDLVCIWHISINMNVNYLPRFLLLHLCYCIYVRLLWKSILCDCQTKVWWYAVLDLFSNTN